MLVYPKLDTAEQIRVLKFKGQDTDDRLNFSLDCAHLGQDSFVAASYTWDSSEFKRDAKGRVVRPLTWERIDETPSDHITVNNTDFVITQNLHRFLQTIMQQELRSRPLFVDQICINQNDESEKAQQVGLMGKVYSCAVEVVAWVAPLMPLEEPHTGCLRRLRSEPGLHDFLKNPQSLAIPDAQKRRFAELARSLADNVDEMLHSTYWARQWIVQEVMLANKLTLYIGPYGFDWEVLLNLLLHYSTLGDDLGITEDSNDPDDGMVEPSHLPLHDNDPRVYWLVHRFGTMLYTKQKRTRQSGRVQPQRLSEVLVRFGGRDCKNQRDKVFSLLGLANTAIMPRSNMSLGRLYLLVLSEGLFDFFGKATFRPDAHARLLSFLHSALESCALQIWDPTVALITTRVMSKFKMDSEMRDQYVTGIWLWQQYGVISTGLKFNLRFAAIKRRYSKVQRTLQRAQASDQRLELPERNLVDGPGSVVTRTYTEWLKMADDIDPLLTLYDWKL